MKIIIVGGTGNISTSIVRRLLEQGHDVSCYNRGQNSRVPEGVRQITGDRANRPAFEATMQREKFDAAIDMISFNAEDAQSSLRAFRDVGHFVQCSTTCTYGIDYDWLPCNEEHPLRPTTDYGRGKVAADNVLLEAWETSGFPVTIIKPSTTYGPQLGLLRQIAWDFSWIDRVFKGKPIVICGDGNALHQFLHVDDAALAFAGVLAHEKCKGEVYNMTNRSFVTWADYHRLAMQVIGREVELVGVPFQDLKRMEIPGFGICEDIFAHHIFYDSQKLRRDVPEFEPQISLREGMTHVLEAMQGSARIPDSDESSWEDEIIVRQKAAFPEKSSLNNP